MPRPAAASFCCRSTTPAPMDIVDLILPDEEATARWAGLLADAVVAEPLAEQAFVVHLSGDLGAGKTALARAVIRTLVGDPRLTFRPRVLRWSSPMTAPPAPSSTQTSTACRARRKSTNSASSTTPPPSSSSNGPNARHLSRGVPTSPSASRSPKARAGTWRSASRMGGYWVSNLPPTGCHPCESRDPLISSSGGEIGPGSEPGMTAGESHTRRSKRSLG